MVLSSYCGTDNAKAVDCVPCIHRPICFRFTGDRSQEHHYAKTTFLTPPVIDTIQSSSLTTLIYYSRGVPFYGQLF